MFRALENHLLASFKELMEELRSIHEELEMIRGALTEERPHPALRPATGSGGRKR